MLGFQILGLLMKMVSIDYKDKFNSIIKKQINHLINEIETI